MIVTVVSLTTEKKLKKVENCSLFILVNLEVRFLDIGGQIVIPRIYDDNCFTYCYIMLPPLQEWSLMLHLQRETRYTHSYGNDLCSCHFWKLINWKLLNLLISEKTLKRLVYFCSFFNIYFYRLSFQFKIPSYLASRRTNRRTKNLVEKSTVSEKNNRRMQFCSGSNQWLPERTVV